MRSEPRRRWRAATLVVAGWVACGGGDRAIGEPCEEKEECAAGLCLQAERLGAATGWTEGYCTTPCSAACPEDATCGEVGEDRYCLAPCAAGADCRDGYVCDPGPAACVPDCRAAPYPCPADTGCDTDGVCRADGGPDPTDPTDPTDLCAEDADCAAVCPAAARLGCGCFAGACLPLCEVDDDCPVPPDFDLECDPTLGHCVPDSGRRGPGPGPGGPS